MPHAILVVDDDEELALTVHDVLKRNGYRVSLAFNGVQALRQVLFTKPTPDLILLDIILPGMSGFEVLEVLDASPQANVPVILISGSRPNGKHKRFAYLGKPLDETALLAKIREKLEGVGDAA